MNEFGRPKLPLRAVIIGLLLCGIAAAAPDSASIAGLTSPSVLSMIGSTGDDAFSTMSLSLVDPSGTPTQHYGASDGTTTVVEQFKNGSFVTNATASPGACDSSDGYGPGTVDAGHTGSMHGYFIISGTLIQQSTSPFCDAVTETNDDCTTATFIDTHFYPCYGLTCTVSTFFDHYSAGDQNLAVHEWKERLLRPRRQPRRHRRPRRSRTTADTLRLSDDPREAPPGASLVVA